MYVGGTTAETADYFSAVSSPTLFVLLFVLGLSFVVLMLAFRSLVIACGLDLAEPVVCRCWPTDC